MSISFVKNTGYEETAQSSTMALTPGNTVGNLLVLQVASRNTTALATVSSVADTGGNTWARFQSDSHGPLDGECWWTVATAVCGTLTVTWGGTSPATTTGTAEVLEWNSTIGWPASPPDAFTAAGGAGTALTTGTSGATVQASEVVVAMAVAVGTGTFTAQTAGYTVQTQLSSLVPSLGAIMQTAYLVLTATGTQLYHCTDSASTTGMATLATVKEATGPGVALASAGSGRAQSSATLGEAIAIFSSAGGRGSVDSIVLSQSLGLQFSGGGR